MMKMIHDNQLEMILPVIVIAVTGTSIGGSIWAHDPHWLNRGGALISAIAACAILLQISSEVKIEEEKKRLEGNNSSVMNDEPTRPTERIEKELITKRIEHLCIELTKTRLEIARRVITCAVLGELLHGFGDLLMEGILNFVE